MKSVAPLLLLLGTLAFALAVVRASGRSRPSTRYDATRVEGLGFPKRLVGGGSEQTIAAPPRRVASLTVTADEILTAMIRPERIVAVTHFADDPIIETSAGRAPPSAARIRGTNPEGIIALEPDLVFVAHYTLESGVRLLGSAAIPVVRLRETRSFADVAENVLVVARALGDEARAKTLLDAMGRTLASVEERTRGRTPPRVLYYSAVGYTSGARTLLDEKIRLAGGRNVAAEAGLVGFRSVALDVLASLDPDVIVVPRWSGDVEAPVRDVVTNPAFRNVEAVRKGRVHALTAGELTSESPEGVRGVIELCRLLHPEAFAS